MGIEPTTTGATILRECNTSQHPPTIPKKIKLLRPLYIVSSTLYCKE